MGFATELGFQQIEMCHGDRKAEVFYLVVGILYTVVFQCREFIVLRTGIEQRGVGCMFFSLFNIIWASQSNSALGFPVKLKAPVRINMINCSIHQEPA